MSFQNNMRHWGERNVPAILVVVLGCVIGVVAVIGFPPQGPTMQQIAMQQTSLRARHEHIQRVRALPLYPRLVVSWRQTKARLLGCGLSFKRINADGELGLYSGPAASWSAVVDGSTRAVAACFLTMPEEFNVIPARFSVDNHHMTLWFSVLGRLPDASQHTGAYRK